MQIVSNETSFLGKNKKKNYFKTSAENFTQSAMR